MISLYLHGGYAEKPQSYKYQALIASHAPGPILYLGHANPDPVRRIQKQQQLIDRCTQLSPNLKFTIGSNHPSTLTKQLASHQIWVLGGGEVQRLLDVFTKLELKSLLHGKTIFGSSAGAMLWCTFWYSPDTDTYGPGLGIVPVSIFVHYTPNHKPQTLKLQNLNPQIPILKLPEHRFKHFKISKPLLAHC